MPTKWVKVGPDDWRLFRVKRGEKLVTGTFVYLTADGTIAAMPETIGFVGDYKTQRELHRKLRETR